MAAARSAVGLSGLRTKGSEVEGCRTGAIGPEAVSGLTVSPLFASPYRVVLGAENPSAT